MTSADRALILVTSRLLRAAGKFDWLSIGFTLLAAAAIMFGTPNRLAAIVAIILGIMARFYSVRIALDARLLEDVAAEQIVTEELDDALRSLKFAAEDKAGRPWLDRCNGAKRLVVISLVLTLLQCVAVILMGFCGGVS